MSKKTTSPSKAENNLVVFQASFDNKKVRVNCFDNGSIIFYCCSVLD